MLKEDKRLNKIYLILIEKILTFNIVKYHYFVLNFPFSININSPFLTC